MSDVTGLTTFGQIQKKDGGHLHNVSLSALTQSGFIPSRGAEYKNEHHMHLPNGGPCIEVAEHRIKDIIDNVRDGYADWGIVSTDGLERWRSAQSEVCDHNQTVEIFDLGLAGCCSMLLVPKEHERRDWKGLIEQGPIVTSSMTLLRKFFIQHGITDLSRIQIVERQGGTEPLARRMIRAIKKPVMILDLVATGNSAFSNGFVPARAEGGSQIVLTGEESRVILICEQKEKSQALKAFCRAVETHIERIRENSLRIYTDMLAVVSEEAPAPEARNFAAARMRQINPKPSGAA